MRVKCSLQTGRPELASDRRAPYTRTMTFRERLFATVAAARAVIEEPGVLIVGSEVPNFLEPRSASTLIVSQDLDIGVPIDRHAAVKSRLGGLHDFRPSAEEPSVWLPRGGGLLEINFVGIDAAQAVEGECRARSVDVDRRDGTR